MTPKELAAIRQRDKEAERCRECSLDESDGRHSSIAICSGWMGRECDKPHEHHKYQPGGFSEYHPGAESDRRALLVELDRLTADFADND